MEPAHACSLLPIAENGEMTFGQAAKGPGQRIGFGLEHTFRHWLHVCHPRIPSCFRCFSELPKETTKPAQFEPAPLPPCRDHANQTDHEEEHYRPRDHIRDAQRRVFEIRADLIEKLICNDQPGDFNYGDEPRFEMRQKPLLHHFSSSFLSGPRQRGGRGMAPFTVPVENG